MHRITIAEYGIMERGFSARLSFDGGTPFNIVVTNPFGKKKERALEWYFEEWQRFPFVGAMNAKQAAASIKAYGTQLFDQVFFHEQARSEYGQLRGQLQGQLHAVRIEVVSQSPGFQALHWEAIWDPADSRPLAVDCTLVRKSQSQPPARISVRPSTVLNILVVVARPEAELDAGYRTISRPLVEAVAEGKLRVNVELLRPGTFEALSKQLEDRGPGFYHLVHFDSHGCLLDYEGARRALNYQQDARYGRKRLKPYRGTKAFLNLETGAAGEVDLIAANELAKLLVRHNVPVCILNACQSGKQLHPVGPSADGVGGGHAVLDTSLGSCLMTSGVQLVLAMAYRVTISAVQIMMKALYRNLFDQQPILEALRLGRLELHCQKERTGYLNNKVDMEDWLLPVIYTNVTEDLFLGDFQDCKDRELCVDEPQGQSELAKPTYGFVGRDLEILRIEKMLLQHNMMLLQGMGGTGKTTLLAHLCEWWQMTHFVTKAFYFGYDRQPWTVQQIVHHIAQEIYSQTDQRKLQTWSDQAQVDELAVKLRGGCYVLVLDNLESVTGQELAITNSLPSQERAKIRDFLHDLVGGKTLVVLGSRCGEDWLRDAFNESVYRLEGLDHDSRSVLAQRILSRVGCDMAQIAALHTSDSYKQLMKMLAGHPLAMEVVLANLEQQTPGQILAGLNEADVNLDVSSDDKTCSLVSCVEYSYRSISPRAQQVLVCLAYFKVTLVWKTLQLYFGELQKMAPFASCDFEHFEDAVKDAAAWGLLSPTDLCSFDGNSQVLNMQPVFPYFLGMKVSKLSEGQQRSLRTSFKNTYNVVASMYNKQMLSKNSVERNLGVELCLREYENLYSALEMCIKDRESMRISACLHRYFELKSDFHRGLKLAQFVCDAHEKYPSDDSAVDLKLERVDARHWLGYGYLKLKAHKKAVDVHQDNLLMCQSIPVDSRDKMVKLSRIHHHLGMGVESLGDLEEARRNYQLALDISTEISDYDSQMRSLHQLGNVTLALRDFEKARQIYHRELDMCIECDDHHSQARVYQCLGAIAIDTRELAVAQKNFMKAMCINMEFSDHCSAAHNYMSLGNVAEELREWEEAHDNYQRALDIYIKLDDQYSQAESHHRLGNIALARLDFADARQSYRGELNICTEFGDHCAQAAAYHQLGRVAEELGDIEEARGYYHQSLALKVDCGDRYSQAPTYHQLGNVALKLGEYDEARRNYLEEIDICIQFKDRFSQARAFHQLGDVSVALREFGQARKYNQETLDICIQFGDLHGQAGAHHRLGNIALEQGDLADARQSYRRELNICTEFGDYRTQAAARHQLGRVAEELGDIEGARGYYRQSLALKVDFGDRYSQAPTYHQLGNVALKLGEYDEARRNYLEEIDICIQFKDRFSQARAFHQLGDVSVALREFGQARKCYREKLDICIQFGDLHGQADAYYKFGVVAEEQLEFDAALENYQISLDLCGDLNYRRTQAEVQHRLGNVALALENYEEAKQRYQWELDTWIEFDYRGGQSQAYHQLGRVAEELGDLEGAFQNYQKSLDIDIESGIRHSQACTYHQFGNLALRLGELEMARQCYQQEMDLCIECNDRHSQGRTFLQLGRVAEELKDFQEARNRYQQALTVYTDFNDHHGQSVTNERLRHLAVEWGEPESSGYSHGWRFWARCLGVIRRCCLVGWNGYNSLSPSPHG